MKTFEVTLTATVQAHSQEEAIMKARLSDTFYAQFEGYRHRDGSVYPYPGRAPKGFRLVKGSYSYESRFYSDDEYQYETETGHLGFAVPLSADRFRINLNKGYDELAKIPTASLMWDMEKERWVPVDFEKLLELLEESWSEGRCYDEEDDWDESEEGLILGLEPHDPTIVELYLTGVDLP